MYKKLCRVGKVEKQQKMRNPQGENKDTRVENLVA